MRLVLRVLAAVVLALGVTVVGGSGTAHACSCGVATPSEQYDDATAVFAGTLDETISYRFTDNQAFHRFRVHEVFKGEIGRQVELVTASQGPACAPDFAEGGRYLVYAFTHRRQLTTGSCSANVTDPSPATLDAVVGSGHPPSASIALPPPRWSPEDSPGVGELWLGLGAVAGAAALVAVGLTWSTRRTWGAVG